MLAGRNRPGSKTNRLPVAAHHFPHPNLRQRDFVAAGNKALDSYLVRLGGWANLQHCARLQIYFGNRYIIIGVQPDCHFCQGDDSRRGCFNKIYVSG
ncbi:MAG: hypothetical protein Fur0044_33850 [Anaerolineae bacterium]